jgi:hypothetical protein
MKTKLAVLSAMGVAAVLATACGHDDNTTMNMTPAPPPTTQSLDTAAVLGMARMSSETSEPMTVDDGAVALADTSETTDPISVAAM